MAGRMTERQLIKKLQDEEKASKSKEAKAEAEVVKEEMDRRKNTRRSSRGDGKSMAAVTRKRKIGKSLTLEERKKINREAKICQEVEPEVEAEFETDIEEQFLEAEMGEGRKSIKVKVATPLENDYIYRNGSGSDSDSDNDIAFMQTIRRRRIAESAMKKNINDDNTKGTPQDPSRIARKQVSAAPVTPKTSSLISKNKKSAPTASSLISNIAPLSSESRPALASTWRNNPTTSNSIISSNNNNNQFKGPPPTTSYRPTPISARNGDSKYPIDGSRSHTVPKAPSTIATSAADYKGKYSQQEQQTLQKFESLVSELMKNQHHKNNGNTARMYLHNNDVNSVDMSGSFMRDEKTKYDFFDENDKGEILLQSKIPIFPEDFPPGRKEWPLSWWGIVDPSLSSKRNSQNAAATLNAAASIYHNDEKPPQEEHLSSLLSRPPSGNNCNLYINTHQGPPNPQHPHRLPHSQKGPPQGGAAWNSNGSGRGRGWERRGDEWAVAGGHTPFGAPTRGGKRSLDTMERPVHHSNRAKP